MSEELARTRAALVANGIDIAVLSSIANVTYTTGFEVPVPLGAGFEMTYAPWLAVVPKSDGEAALVAPASAPEIPGFTPVAFEGFDSFNPTDPAGTYLASLLTGIRLAGGVGGRRGTIGIELRSLPAIALRAIETTFTNWTIVDVEPALTAARKIKTAREIGLLRRAAAIADVAHTTLAELCREAGRTEFEMFATISRRVFEAAGRDIPLTGELVTGPRTRSVNYPGGPRARTTERGDAALMDLSGRTQGYWFDCTNTHLIGGVEPTVEQLRYARASQDACEAGMNALRPGALACDAAEAAAAAFARHGLPVAHYTGHQIGVTVNELPRLVPYDQTPIEAGMVFSVEPGAYQGADGSFGARSEKMVLVTGSGPEVLSTFAWGI